MGALYDTSSQASNNASASSISWSHTLGNIVGSGLIIVGVAGRTTVPNYGNSVVTGVTFNGVAMTKIKEDGNNGGSQAMHVSLWALWGANVPAAGTYTVTATYTGATDDQAAGAMSFRNVRPQTAEASASFNATGNTGPSANLTTLTPNALLVSVYGNQNAFTASSNTGDTSTFVAHTGAECDGFYRSVVAPASATVTLTVTNPEAETLVIASFETLRAPGFAGI